MSFKVRLKKYYRRIVFDLSSKNSWIIKLFYTRYYKPKPGSLEYFYDLLSTQQKNVFVIQVGANDGITKDPVHKFIKRDGWKGVLIEPQEEVFRNSLFPLYMRNADIKLENIAISSENALQSFYRISFCKERWASGLSTTVKSAMEERVNNGYIDMVAKAHKVKTPVDKKDYIEEVKVEYKTFAFLREKYQIKEVDVLQIDAEGFDFELVKMYDLKNNKPKVVVFENHNLSDTDKEAANQYFTDNGYVIKKVIGDSIAVRKDFEIGMNILKGM